MCPPRYFVELCVTISAPSVSGFWKYGVRNVLSTTVSAFTLFAISDTAWMSATFIIGFVGVSMKNIFVFGRIAAFTSSRSDMST